MAPCRILFVAFLTASTVAAIGAPTPKHPSTQPSLTAQQSAIARVIVEGQLYDHMGAGVEGAKVTVVLKSTKQVLGTCMTNSIGDISIESAEQVTGAAVVTFEKKGYKKGSVEVELVLAQVPFVDWEMEGDFAVRGLVLDDRTGEPIAGVTIIAKFGYKESSATTGEDGKFTIEGLPPGCTMIAARAEKYARKTLPAIRLGSPDRRPPPSRELVIGLRPERIVHLTIVDETDHAIAGVDVECYDERTDDYRHLITGEDGKLTIGGLSRDSDGLAVRLMHEGYVSSADYDRVLKFAAGRTETTHRQVMKQAGVITGKLLSAETGDPLGGARMSVGEVLSDLSPRAWSEFDGTYRVIGVTPGEAIVTVYLAGHASELKTVSVRAGSESSLDFTMTPARIVSGTVKDEDGKPLAGAHVAATKWRGYATLGLQAMTDSDGRFEIIDAPLDSFEVSVYQPGFEPLLDQAIDPQAAPVVFALKIDARSKPGQTGPNLTIGDAAPALDLKTLVGESLTSASLEGKVVLLDFWATWCGPCVAEIPRMTELYNGYRKRDGFVMISVSLDKSKEALRSFVKARRMKWHQVFSRGGWADKTVEAYDVRMIPTVFIIGPDGKIAAVDPRGSQIHAELDRLLPEPD